MADSKVSALVATTALADADLVYVAKSPFGAGDSKKLTGANLKASMGAITRAASGSPEGVITANGPAIHYTIAGGLWIFGGTFGTAVGWINLIAE